MSSAAQNVVAKRKLEENSFSVLFSQPNDNCLLVCTIYLRTEEVLGVDGRRKPCDLFLRDVFDVVLEEIGDR